MNKTGLIDVPTNFATTTKIKFNFGLVNFNILIHLTSHLRVQKNKYYIS